MSHSIVIIGAGGFAREIAGLLPGFLPDREWTLKGFLGKDAGAAPDLSLPAPLLGDPDDYTPDPSDALVLAIGHMPSRRRIVDGLTDRGGRFLQLIHPTAFIADSAELGEGVIVYPFAAVSHDARVERCAKLNFYASVGHNGVIGACALLAPYATVNGFSTLEADVYLSTHATVAPLVRVGTRSKLSANSCATKDVPEDSFVFGVPGRVVRQVAWQ